MLTREQPCGLAPCAMLEVTEDLTARSGSDSLRLTRKYRSREVRRGRMGLTY